ncbi:RNA polymerase sigma24 factor [Virgisporangium aliadipatigenens]|uniref:RNA polymerase sigma24 factor n=1 Tax=Virgisporangium aliadipatigenens TaxID=741659 RepID=A0A8J3YF25_9ACTN|nr:SigE family RNA polymerase sigma factor [Virgisporangium aliadipatigenens]GIJ43831.1 RNA polymerase sigma24 factor [Virgisporangium aliadipatigenens]
MKSADEAAFREYVAARMDEMRRIAYLVCHDWHTADDVVAATLLKLYAKWRQAERAENLDGYVRAMLLHTWLDERKRAWRRRESAGALPDRQAPAAPPGDEQGLMALLRGLPPRQRAVVVLRFYADHSIEETAALMGTSVGTVKSQCARALATLRQHAEESGVRP